MLYKHMPTPFSRLAARSFLLHVLKTVGNGYLKRMEEQGWLRWREWREVVLKQNPALCVSLQFRKQKKVDSIILLSHSTNRAFYKLLTQEAFSHIFNCLLTLYELHLNRCSILLSWKATHQISRERFSLAATISRGISWKDQDNLSNNFFSHFAPWYD